MVKMKKNLLLISNKTLSSERARNFQIELIQPSIEEKWQKNEKVRRRRVGIGSVRTNRTSVVAPPETSYIKKSRNSTTVEAHSSSK